MQNPGSSIQEEVTERDVRKFSALKKNRVPDMGGNAVEKNRVLSPSLPLVCWSQGFGYGFLACNGIIICTRPNIFRIFFSEKEQPRQHEAQAFNLSTTVLQQSNCQIVFLFVNIFQTYYNYMCFDKNTHPINCHLLQIFTIICRIFNALACFCMSCHIS